LPDASRRGSLPKKIDISMLSICNQISQALEDFG
jgi:hypothetical protein